MRSSSPTSRVCSRPCASADRATATLERGSASVRLDRDLARASPLALRQLQLEHAVAHRGLDPIGVDLVAEPELAVIAARAVLAVERGPLGIGPRRELAVDQQHALLEP